MDVSFVSTPSDGSCGIGTYAGDLSNNIRTDVAVNRHILAVNAKNPIHFITVAFSAGLSGDDVIHVQHEYGLFGPVSYGSFLFFPILALLARLQRTPVVVTFHSAWNDETVDTPPIRAKQLYIALVNRIVVLSSDHCVFLSKNCMRSFSQSVKPDDFSIFPHGVNEPAHSTQTAAEAKQTFGYDSDATVVTLPGYVRPEKGTDIFAELAERQDDVEFLIAGGSRLNKLDNYLESVRRTAPSNVKITGVLEDEEFHDAFLASDIVILPYKQMTQSGIFNWCAAYDIPVLASEHAYFERLSDEWNCVKTAQIDDLDEFTDKLNALIENTERRDELSSAISTYAEINSFEYVSEQHIGLYKWITQEVEPNGNLLHLLIRSIYDRTIRERLPRKIVSLNGVPARYARLFDSKDTIPEYEDPSVVALNEHVVEAGSVAIVGGGWGVTSVVAARNVGETGNVTTFEGPKAYADKVRETTSLGKVDARVSVVEKTVGGEVFLFGESDTGWLPATDLPECDLLELDVEGAEIGILSNLSVAPETIIVETHGCYAAPTSQVELLLDTNGYNVISKKSKIADRGIDVLVAKIRE
jgi:glycosyltransferase involved in cell wall biosynthesis